jgi:hypothetical protein
MTAPGRTWSSSGLFNVFVNRDDPRRRSGRNTRIVFPNGYTTGRVFSVYIGQRRLLLSKEMAHDRAR